MENGFTIIVWFLGILSVLGIIGIFVGHFFLRDKEQSQT
jgi:hypothetical protein